MLVGRAIDEVGDDRTRTIHVRGDRDVAYGEVMAVMDQLAADGFNKVALLANSHGEPSARAPQPAAAR